MCIPTYVTYTFQPNNLWNVGNWARVTPECNPTKSLKGWFSIVTKSGS